mgnify:CR=1 FL=1
MKRGNHIVGDAVNQRVAGAHGGALLLSLLGRLAFDLAHLDEIARADARIRLSAAGPMRVALSPVTT